jgi:glycosyltransferase involved in cell wall biosynthesis
MELIISDDASVDNTFEILQKEVKSYSGPHRIVLRRRPVNSGSKSAHLNDVFRCTSGEIIVLFDDDDISEASRVRKVAEVFRADSEVHAVYSSYFLINQAGRPIGPANVLHPPSNTDPQAWFAKVEACVCGATLAVRRTVVDSFKTLDPNILEDIILPFRASLLGKVRYIDEELVRYRRRAGSATQKSDTFDSMESYRLRVLSGIQQARQHVSSRLSDLETASVLMPDRVEELERLREIVLDSMSDAESSAGLVSPSLRTRVGTLFDLRRRRAYQQNAVVNLCLTFIPACYLKYKRQWYKRRVLDIGRKRAISKRE